MLAHPQFLNFVGLLISLFGFLILVWDLWPEYKIYQMSLIVRHYRILASNKEWIEKMPYPKPGAQQAIEDLLDTIELLNFVSICKKLRISQNLNRPFTLNEYLNYIEKVENLINIKSNNLNNRIRPPIGWGIILVIIGSECR